jgi:hypothetical protein
VLFAVVALAEHDPSIRLNQIRQRCDFMDESPARR